MTILKTTDKKKTNGVSMWMEDKKIPTYEPYEPNKYPIFLENKAYQGASGKVYPIPFTDRLRNDPVDKLYNTINLENEYIKVMVLPQLGGKIHMGYDKSNDYNFVYHNTVIKPAMIGLAGPWVSGGIEFNWPQHHRPTTFMPLKVELEENEDGSKTAWVGEIDPIYRQKGMAGITLCPGRSFIKVKVRLYNRTPFIQNFMWWANLAVHINDMYKLVFPPDVEYVSDHDRRAVISFPEASGVFHTARPFDYGDGTDVSWIKNIPVPTSFMVMNGCSEFDFLSGYDFKKDAGVVHIADHHISPGKKLFTWGNSDFGMAWQRNLTDNDGPYVELMSGVYTDNQPDFSWIYPYETRTFEQYWYPIRGIGEVKNATIDGAVNLEVADGKIGIGFNSTGIFRDCTVILKKADSILLEQKIYISPDKPFKKTVDTDTSGIKETELCAVLLDKNGKVLVSYSPVERGKKEKPQTRLPSAPPEELETTEELFINGLHLEQYKHHTYKPEPYYLEALKLDPGDIRSNTSMGLLNLRRGNFARAEDYLRKALERLISRNPNPYNVEPYYNLGLALRYQGKDIEAYNMFYKAVWHYSFRYAGYTALAEYDSLKGSYEEANHKIDLALDVDCRGIRQRNLKTALLRKLGKTDEALAMAEITSKMDLLDIGSRFEIYLLSMDKNGKMTEKTRILLEKVRDISGNDEKCFIDLAIGYSLAGLYEDSLKALNASISNKGDNGHIDPMVYYYKGYYYYRMGDQKEALNCFRSADKMSSDYCFPSRLESIDVLDTAISLKPSGAKAYYYLGNLLYDKFNYDDAIKNWEKSKNLDPGFPIVHRNLGIAYFEKKNDVEKARSNMEKAFQLDPGNSRLFFELQQLYKNINIPPDERLSLFQKYIKLTEERDDCYLEMAVLLTQEGRYSDAVKMLEKRRFNIYEGGEGKLTRHHGYLHVLMGYEHMKNNEYDKALETFSRAVKYPSNYGEGKSYMAQEAHIEYFTGMAYELKGDIEGAQDAYSKASRRNDRVTEVTYFEGLAYRKMGILNEADKVFKRMLVEGEKIIENCGQHGYFGVGMPIPQVFEGDIARINTVNGAILNWLGNMGLDRKKEAMESYRIIEKLDPYNFKVHMMKKLVEIAG